MEVNKKKEAALKHSTLLNLLEYNPNTGIFIWKVDQGPNAMSGYIAGSPSPDGYLRVKINGWTYLVHRLAWFYTHGQWPLATIDHRDRDRQNNSLSNLRDVSRSVNNRNAEKRSDNTSGTKGVSYNKRNMNWRAYICIDKKQICLGSFLSKESAINARKKAEEKYSDLGYR